MTNLIVNLETIPSADSSSNHIHTDTCTENHNKRSAKLNVMGESEFKSSGLTLEDLEKLSISLTKNIVGNTLPEKELILTREQLDERRKLLRESNSKKCQVRKTIKTKAKLVSISKRAIRRIERGATAQDLLSITDSKPVKRARTLRREASRNMLKLSRKYATKQVEPAKQ